MTKPLLAFPGLAAIVAGLWLGNPDATPAQGAFPTPAPSPVAVGETVPPFDAESITGTIKHVTFPKGSRTVLLFFLSSCPTCHRMIPEWNRAYERRPSGLEVLGVLMDREPVGFFAATPISFPVVRSPGREFLQNQYRIYRAPTTLRVGPGGKVEDVSVGLLDPIRTGEIFRP